MFPKVLLGVVLYNNTLQEIDKFIELLHLDKVDVIFWNNGVYSSELQNYTIISNGKNLGFGAGHNQLYQRAKREDYEYYVCSNLDVNFTMKDLEVLIQSWSEVDNMEICTPKIVEKDRVRIDRLPRFSDKLFSFLSIRRAHVSDELDTLVPIELGSGCFFVVNIANYRNSVLFDERFFMYEEDTDLYRRCWDRKSAYVNAAVIISHGYAGGSKKKAKLFLYHLSSLVKYYLKWPTDIFFRP